jgi:hypothetical protein
LEITVDFCSGGIAVIPNCSDVGSKSRGSVSMGDGSRRRGREEIKR